MTGNEPAILRRIIESLPMDERKSCCIPEFATPRWRNRLAAASTARTSSHGLLDPELKRILRPNKAFGLSAIAS